MRIAEIRTYPTTYETDGVKSVESLLRSFHIVQKVKDLCAENTSPKIILELIEEMEGRNERGN